LLAYWTLDQEMKKSLILATYTVKPRTHYKFPSYPGVKYRLLIDGRVDILFAGECRWRVWNWIKK